MAEVERPMKGGEACPRSFVNLGNSVFVNVGHW